MSESSPTKQTTLNIGGLHIQVYNGCTATDFERKVSEVCAAAQLKGIPASTWLTPGDALPVKEVPEYAFAVPGTLNENPTQADIDAYQGRVRMHAEGKRASQALDNAYRLDIKVWEEHKKVRTEGMGYLRVIFQDGKLASAMRGQNDPYNALMAMRQMLGIANPEQLMSTIGASIVAIPFTTLNQRDEEAVTGLLKKVLDLMYLVQERLEPVTDGAAAGFLSHLQTKLRMVTPNVPMYNTLVSGIIQNPRALVPPDQEGTAGNVFRAVQLEIILNVENQELRTGPRTGAKRQLDKTGQFSTERGKGGFSGGNQGRKKLRIGRAERAGSGVDTSTWECNNCGEIGHGWRKCPNAVMKEKRGGGGKQVKKRIGNLPRQNANKGLAATVLEMSKRLDALDSASKASQARQVEREDMAGAAMVLDDPVDISKKASIDKLDDLINKFSNTIYTRTPSHTIPQGDLIKSVLKGHFAAANGSSVGDGLVIWDSGASKWMTPAKMPGMVSVSGRKVTIADGTDVNIEGSGARIFNFGAEQRMIPDVLVVPKFKDELISVSHVLRGTKDALVFTDNAAYMVVAPGNTTHMVGVQTHGLYHRVPTQRPRFSWVRVPRTTAEGTVLQGNEEYGSSGDGLINHRGIHDKRHTSSSRDVDWNLMQSSSCQGGQNPDKDCLVAAQGSTLTIGELHEWFGHLNHSILNKTVERNGTIKVRSRVDDVTSTNCPICLKMKMRRKPIVTTDHPAPRLLYRIHTDLVPLPTGTSRGHNYWLIFIDEWSRWIEIISIRSKDDYPMEVERLVTRWENEHQEKGLKVAQIRSDGELVRSNRYNGWCAAHGIIAEASPAYTKEFNGLTEANIGTLKNMGNCMRVKANLPLKFAVESVIYAGFIKNRVLHPFTDETPFFRWNGREPNLSLVKPFGSEVWATIPPELRSLKNPEKAAQGIFLGYRGNIMPIVGLLRSNGQIGRTVIAYHVQWMIESFPGITEGSKVNSERLNVDFEHDSEEEENDDHVDDVDAAGGNDDNAHHQISTNTQPSSQPPNTPIKNSGKNSGTLEGGVEGDEEIENLWVVLGESDVSEEEEVVTPPKRMSGAQRTRWSKRLSDISEKMRRRNLDGKALLAALKAETMDIGRCMDTEYPDVPVRERDLPVAPKSLKTALASPYASKWAAAMLKEQDSLMRKGVWSEEILPKSTGGQRPHVISCKWVFAYKVGRDGYLEKFKARLVARGFTQKRGVHFDKVFSPVVKIQSVRLLTAAAFASGFYMHQFDVDVAYLNGEMDYVNYMTMPPGLEKLGPNGEQMVCKLVKGLYGTRQAGRLWYLNLIQYLKEIGFSMIESDRCVMVLKGSVSSTGAPALIAIYVDDCIVVSPSMELITELKTRFHEKYSIKDLGDAKWMLKIQIERMSENGTEVLWMGQPQYVAKLQDQFKAWLPVSSRKITTPMMVSWKHDDESPVLIGHEKAIYRSIIASMSYLAQQTRLDIVCPVNHLAQFLQLPRQCHKAAVSRILGYLAEYPDLGPTYFRTKDLSGAMKTFLSDGVTELTPSIAPVGASDASWGSEQNYKSRTGIIFRFAGGPVTWYSGKQVPTAASATEAELYALGDAIKEAMFLRNVLTELGIKHQSGTLVLEDNTAAIDIAGDPKHHARVKHIGIRLSLIREAVTEGIVKLEWCPTAHMLADLLTKALPQETFWRMLDSIGMRRLSRLSVTEVYP